MTSRERFEAFYTQGMGAFEKDLRLKMLPNGEYYADDESRVRWKYWKTAERDMLERMAQEFDKRNAPLSGGFYEPEEPARIIRDKLKELLNDRH